MLLAVGTCVVLTFEAMPGLFCFLLVTQALSRACITFEQQL